MLPRSLPAAFVATAFLLLIAPAAQAQIPPIPTIVPTVVPDVDPSPRGQPYQANDGKGFRDILPPAPAGATTPPSWRRSWRRRRRCRTAATSSACTAT
jgi:hypothetical protein